MLKRVGLLLLAIFIAAGISLLWGKQHIESYAERTIALQSEQLFQLKPGTSFRRLAAELKTAGVIDDDLQLRLWARLNEQSAKIKRGEYRITPGLSHQDLIQLFVDGKVVQRQVSLIEGLRVSDYLSKLAAHPDLVQTLKEQSPEQVAKQLGITSGKLEGWIYPDTYSFTKGTTDLDILTRAYQRMKKVLDQEWQQKQKGLPLKTPYEALILASIVEKETGVAFERPEIAGVFIRRLQKKMRLQTDPTVIYGMGDRYKGNITRADLKRKTAYNTYQIKGLPPTPIANPGMEAIRAVLNPAAGKALYFVAKGDGSHQFSATYAEHNKAVQHYQRSKRRKDYRSAPPSSALSKPKQQQKADS